MATSYENQQQNQEPKATITSMNRDNGGFLSNVFTTKNVVEGTEAAVALGASAALFTRLGGGRFLARSFDRSERFLRHASHSLAGKSLGDITISDVTKAINDGRNSIHNDLRNEIDPRDTRGLFGLISQMKAFETSNRDLARAAWRQEKLIAPTINEFQKNHPDMSVNEFRRFEEFTHQVALRPKDMHHTYGLIKKNGWTSTEDNNMAMSIVDEINKRNEPKLRRQFYHRTLKRIRDIRNQAYDISSLEKSFGTSRKKGIVGGMWQTASGDRAQTVRDILAHKSDYKKAPIYYERGGRQRQADPIEELEKLRRHYANISKEAEKRFLDITPDAGTLRVDASGRRYSRVAQRKFMDKMMSGLAGTLPGKIAHMRAVDTGRHTPKISLMFKGTYDPILASITNKNYERNHINRLDNSYVNIHGRYFRIDDDKLTEMKNINSDDYELIHGKLGSTQNLLHQMTGDVREKAPSNAIMNWFGIGKNRSEFNPGAFTDKIKGIFTKKDDPNFRGNIINSLINPDYEQRNAYLRGIADKSVDDTYAFDYFDKMKNLEEFMRGVTHKLSAGTVKKLSDNTSGTSHELFDVLNVQKDDEMLQRLMSLVADTQKESGSFINQDLNKIVHRLNSDPSGAQAMLQRQVADGIHIGSGIGDVLSTAHDEETITFGDILRREVGKEALLQHAVQETAEGEERNYESILNLLDKSELSESEDAEARRMTHLAIFQDNTGVNTPNNVPSKVLSSNVDAEQVKYEGTDPLWNKVINAHDFLSESNSRVSQDFRETIEDTKNEFISPFEGFYESEDTIGNPQQYNEWVTMRKTIGVRSIIRAMNDETKGGLKAGAIKTKDMLLQLVSGKDTMGSVTNATFLPYFFGARLSDELNKVGVGLASDNMGSLGSMMFGFAAKRVLPVALGATYLEWGDDTVQEITGTSVSGAAANGLANLDIASRKVLDAVGLTDWLKGEKDLNPIMQYWGGHEKFQNADERKKYYESGYTPVRKGAWWTFGSVNEARGAEIQYWEPTFARRINSDYKDKSLYDGYFDKWSHSLLPTPSNPLSPLKAILDPYWLEEKHKDDRPYPLTGHMFADGTPWGAVLNPTIGELLKPQKDLHTFMGFHYRMRNGVDVKSLVRALNENIKSRARDFGHQNLIAIKGDSVTPVRFTGYDAPSEDVSVASYQFSNGKLIGQSKGVYGAYNPSGGEGPGDIGNGSAKNGGAGGTGAGTAAGGITGTGLHRLEKDDITSAVYNIDDHNHHIGFKDAIRNKLFGDPIEHNDQLVTDKKGNIAVYSDQYQKPDYKKAGELKLTDIISLDAQINGDDFGIKKGLVKIINAIDPRKILRSVNEGVKEKAHASQSYQADEFDTGEGILSPDKLKHYRPSQGMALLNNPDDVAELIHQGKGSDFVREAAVSWRLISGIYGYAGGEALGIGTDRQKRIATGQDMTSFSRTFWDSNLGGAGGGVMEIARRLIPDFRRNSRVNPMANEMPDWMPDRFRTGDPFAAIPKGEMRLPGKGYESLNKLHPDQYGAYGAFDRFKILADIAPFSPEYRMWREIAKKTIADPELKEEMSDIRERVTEQGKKHDFYDYKVIGNDFQYKNIYVGEILGYGKFRSGDKIYKIAGAKIKANDNETMVDVLGRYITPGQKVTVAVDANSDTQSNNDADYSIDASVFVNGININREMIKNGDAVLRKGDQSSAAVLAQYGPIQRIAAYAAEAIAHLDVPFLSDQFLRVRSPLESYKAEEVYGTPYQTWSHPIDTFLLPAIERSFHDRSMITSIASTMFENMEKIPGINPIGKKAITGAYLLTNRGAFIGAALENVIAPSKTGVAMHWARWGSRIATLGHAATGGNGYIDEATSIGYLGEEVARFFEKDRGLGGVIGAGLGLLYHATKKDSDRDNWIPGRIKKKWDMEDYFDRLTYLKYMGLYQQAAEKAKEEEGVDLYEIIKKQEEQQEQRDASRTRILSLKKTMRQVLGSNARVGDERKRLMQLLGDKLKEVDQDTDIVDGGKYTHSALIYKQAADATMFGLKENASWTQIITALPQNDREYFMEFVKERDKGKRAEILDVASPFLRAALSKAWKMDPVKVVDNEHYFKKHALPDEKWQGWRPDVDLKDVEVKTIENEAMNLSDFGFYESQLRNPQVANAPKLSPSDHKNSGSVSKMLKKILAGRGLQNVEVNVSTNAQGDETQLMADIKAVTSKDTMQKRVNEQMKLQSQHK